jgi:hypothetical protein
MNLLKTNELESIFNHVDITSNLIEQTIKDYTLEFSPIKNDFVEWKMKFPTFLTSFYKYVYKEKTIPTQDQFWSSYLIDNIKFFDKKNFSEDIILALKARVYRTYPSLVRDIHFTCYVKENINGDVIYNTKLDVEDGIDMLISYNDKHYAINLFTATKRSFKSREKKEKRHKKYDNLIYIELPVEFKGSYICGDFFLYKENEYKKLINELGFVENPNIN